MISGQKARMGRSKCIPVILAFLALLTTGVLPAQHVPDTLRVMTFNILHGATTRNDFNLDTLAGMIRRFDPDLVALQEVDVLTNRAKGYDLATELGYRTKMAPVFARAMPYDGGEYGEAVLSRFGFEEFQRLALPHRPLSEPRAAAKVTVQTSKGNKVVFIGTHLDHLPENIDRVAQAQALVEALRPNGVPTILTGDMNDGPGSATLKILETDFRKPGTPNAYLNTWPANDPIKSLDHILLDQKSAWEVIDYQVVCENYASDHCVVVATLILNP